MRRTNVALDYLNLASMLKINQAVMLQCYSEYDIQLRDVRIVY